MSTEINLKKEVQHKVGEKSIDTSADQPTLTISNPFLHKTIHAAGHDLRSPLFIIRSYSQLLQRTQEQNVLQNGLQLMDEATVKMEKTINELVGLIDIYTLPFPQKTSVSFENAFETAQFQIVRLLNKHQPKFSFDFKDFPTVDFDDKYLVDILTYLLDNAIRHNSGKENLEIHVASKKVDGEIVLVVQDNGRGIIDDPEKIKTAFYTYTVDEDLECIGMGLTKIQAIAKASQSSFFIQSEPGISTTGSFVFKSKN